MWTSQFWRETLERAIKSFAQAILLATGLGEGLNLFAVDWGVALGFGGGGFLLSILTSMASAPFGQGNTPSLVPTIDPPPREPAEAYREV